MSFITVKFALFFLIVCIVYFVFPKKYRWTILLLASYYFYFSVSVKLSIFLIATTLSVYGCARFVSAINETTNNFFKGKDNEWLEQNKELWQKKFKWQKRWVLIIALLFNFSILAFFKYFDWFANILDPISAKIGLGSFSHIGASWRIIMPLGISFYTFQSIGYLIDVFMNKVTAEKNIFKFALFSSFFPQLIQGPISRFDQLAPQLYEGHKFEIKRAVSGGILILWGAFKMLCISIPMYIVFQNLSSTVVGIQLFFTLLCFSIYLYTAFSGGIDIARGLAQILGIDMVENFKRPYFATSISDFWKRWHITLGTWFKDYVAYPITLSKWFNKVRRWFRNHFKGNFGKIMPTCIVMFFIFFLIGIWHGPQITRVFYGLYMGILVSFGYFMKEPLRKWGEKHPRITKKNKLLYLLAIVYTFFIVFIGRIFIIAPDLSTAWDWFIKLFDYHGGKDFIKAVSQIFGIGTWQSAMIENSGLTLWNYRVLFICTLALLFVSLAQEFGLKVRDFILKQAVIVQTLAVSMIIVSITFFMVYPPINYSPIDYDNPNYQQEHENYDIPEVRFPYERY